MFPRQTCDIGSTQLIGLCAVTRRNTLTS